MNTIFSGLAVGALYALVAATYNIVFLATGTFNFAQAQFLVLGTFLAYTGFVSFHWPLLLVLAGGLLVGGLAGAVEERVAIRPIQGTGVHGELITTIGFSSLLIGLVVLVWGPNPLTVPSALTEHPLEVLTGRILPTELLLIGLGCAVALGGELISRRTILGLTSLATSEDRVAAMVRGIDVRRLSIGSYLVAGAVCAGAGALIAPITFATVGLGDALALKGFVALAVGGMGSQKGALVGGMGVGLVEALTGRYLDVNFENIAIFALLVVVLMARPTGLFGQSAGRTV